MKEVRAHSEKGDAAVPRVVGIVVALSCRGMEAIVSVMSWVRAPCGGSLAAQAEWRPSLDGVGRVGTCVRDPGGSGESELASEALRVVVSMFFFCVFHCSDLGIPYYGTQQ